MRVLYVDALANPPSWANTKGIIAAYRRAGVDLDTFDYRSAGEPAQMNAALKAKALEFRPDFIHLGKGETIRGATVRAIKKKTGCKVAHFYGDLRWEVQPFVADIGKAVDWTLFQHKDEAQYAMYRKAGCKQVGFWMEGADPSIFYRRNVPQTWDVVFMANAPPASIRMHQERWELIRQIAAAGFGIHVFGTGWGKLKGTPNVRLHEFVALKKFALAVSRARICLGYSTDRVRWYTSWPRLLNSMCSGGFYLTHYWPGLEELFHQGIHLDWFGDIPEAVRKVKYWIGNGKLRQLVAYNGRNEVVAKHTWDHRIAEMLEYAK